MKKFKENFKRFWSLQKHSTGGFTLVELIVVIAILAILAGIAVPAYSGYVEKANKQADQTLVSEVKQALELYHYSNPEATKGYVVLNQEGTGSTADAMGDAAMEDMFGANWKNTVGLKYDDWNGNYGESSYRGYETEMMGKVEGLTDLLGGTIAEMPTLIGDNFTEFMSAELGFSAEDMENYDKAADAAVLYVANGTSKLTPEQQEEFKKVALNALNEDAMFPAMLAGFSDIYDSDVMGAAATYAMLTAYCQYEDSIAGNTKMMDALGTPDSSEISTGSLQEMTSMIQESVSRLDALLDEGEGLNFEKYWTDIVSQDAAAFIDMMGTVNNAKGQVIEKLGTSGCFTSQELQDLFTNYGSGAITVLAEIQGDGTITVTTVPDID